MNHHEPRDGDTASSFEKEFWEEHWQQRYDPAADAAFTGESPYLVEAVGAVPPSTALDAGCGTGAEAVWLARQGWRVTGVDISQAALASAVNRETQASVVSKIHWIEADLTSWQPDGRFDLVVTQYAHAAMPQLDLYARISKWVAPGGTLLIVGHLPGDDGGHSHERPRVHATATPAEISAILPAEEWDLEVASEGDRHVGSSRLHDAVVRARRKS